MEATIRHIHRHCSGLGFAIRGWAVAAVMGAVLFVFMFGLFSIVEKLIAWAKGH